MLNPKDLIALIQTGKMQIDVSPKPVEKKQDKETQQQTEQKQIVEQKQTAEQKQSVEQKQKTERKQTAEHKQNVEKQSQNRKDAGQLTVDELCAMDNYDHFHKTQLTLWLKQMGMLDKIESLYFCDNSKEIILRMKEHDAADQLSIKLIALQFSLLGRTGFSYDELRRVVLPSTFFSGLFGFKYIPFEKNSINKDIDPEIEKDEIIINYNAKEIRNFKNVEIKLPYIPNKLAPRVLYYILSRIEKYGFNPELFQDQDKLPTLDELLVTLPEPAADAEALFKKYADLNILHLQVSKIALGFTRILSHNFEETLKGLAKLPCKDAEFAKKMCESLRSLSPAIGIDSAILYKLLTKFYGDNPSMRLGQPVILDKQVLVPSEIDVPAPEIPGKIRRTIFLLDLSGSMAWGRLDAAKKATNSVLKELADNPDEEVAAIGYSDSASLIFPVTKLNKNNLAQLQDKINALEARGGTFIHPALDEMLKHFPNEKEAELIGMSVLLLTDGEFRDGDIGDGLDVMLKEKFDKFPVTFNCIGLDLKPGGDEERDLASFVKFSKQKKMGGQLKFTPTASVDKVMRTLVLNEGNGGRSGISGMFVKYFDKEGAELGSTQISPCAFNRPTFAHLPISFAALNYLPFAKDLGMTALPITVEIVYDTGAKANLFAEIPCDLLNNPKEMTLCNRNHFIKNEFLQQRLLGKVDELSRIEAMMEAYEEAKLLGSKLLMEEVLLRLQPFLKEWRARNIKQSFPSKKVKLMHLKALLIQEAEFKHQILVEILEQEIKLLEADLTLNIEELLYEEAGVKDYKEFLALPALKRYEALNKLKTKALKDNPGSVESLDKQINETLREIKRNKAKDCIQQEMKQFFEVIEKTRADTSKWKKASKASNEEANIDANQVNRAVEEQRYLKRPNVVDKVAVLNGGGGGCWDQVPAFHPAFQQKTFPMPVELTPELVIKRFAEFSSIGQMAVLKIIREKLRVKCEKSEITSEFFDDLQAYLNEKEVKYKGVLNVEEQKLFQELMTQANANFETPLPSLPEGVVLSTGSGLDLGDWEVEPKRTHMKRV